MIFDSLVLWLIAIYLFCLPLIGWFTKSKENRLKNYYLAGGSVGFFSLFFTMYASTYSGNTMLGFAGRAYREGPVSFFVVLGMAAVIPSLLLFSRKLNIFAKRYNFVTIADFLRFRYSNNLLIYILNFLLIITLASYILTNLKAAGLLIEVISNGYFPLVESIYAIAFIMVIYQTLGGMRAVIFTDIFQGILLLIGSLTVVTVVLFEIGGFENIISDFKYYAPHWREIDSHEIRRGISLIFMFAFAVAIYPHALQRVYAAKNWNTLKKSLKYMSVMPFITTLPIITTGMIAVIIMGNEPILSGTESDRVIPILLNYLSQKLPYLKWLVAIFMAAALAAIMSTVDSSLLSLSSMFTQDIVRPMIPNISEQQLSVIGRIMTWILMFLMATGAAFITKTLWFLIVLKLEIMLQVAPSIILGVILKKLRWNSVFFGLLAGITTTVLIKFFLELPPMFSGIHAGVFGLLANLITIYMFQSITNLIINRKAI